MLELMEQPGANLRNIKGSDAETPLMKQYWEIKSQHPDKLVFFRMGDFYELFHDDAEVAAPIINVTLTSRNKKAADPTPMCGVPHHSVGTPISRLLKAGHKVVVVEQTEDPQFAKGLVKRAVSRILTPGLVLDPESLETGSSHWIASFDSDTVAFLEPTTGQSFFIRAKPEDRRRWLEKWPPAELIVAPAEVETAHVIVEESRAQRSKVPLLSILKDEVETGGTSKLPEFLQKMAKNLPRSAENLVRYAYALQGEDIARLIRPFEERDLKLGLDISETTIAHLEILETYRGEFEGSLLHAIDRTRTSSGARLLKEWVRNPIADLNILEDRLNRVEGWIGDLGRLKALREVLSRIGDVERRLARLASSTSGPRDLVSLVGALSKGLELEESLADGHTFVEIQNFCSKVFRAIVEEPPVSLKSGYFVREGFTSSLDEWIRLTTRGEELLLQLEERERTRSSIPSLKIRFNQVFGYYFEVTRTHLEKVPPHFVRKQTLANAERFSSPELQELEEKLLSAQRRREELEAEVFRVLRFEALALTDQFQKAAARWSEIDVMSSLAWLAMEQRYTRPQFSDDGLLKLSQSRHPVVEQWLPRGQVFISNSLEIARGQVLLLTGPNMAGKSTLMRQVALITWLAHVGSFVPAERALVPNVDGIFTRIGASDSLIQGMSTFMVEMKETAEILKRASSRSLIILDEIGRGTGTEDGICLARAILEHLLKETQALGLFATHYHELTRASADFSQILNAHMGIIEEGGGIRFLHKLVTGATARSYGVEVARLAGLPSSLVKRAYNLMKSQSDYLVQEAQGKLF